MTLDPISIATTGYVCGSGPEPIAMATRGYVCFAELPTPTEGGGGGGPGARRRTPHGNVILPYREPIPIGDITDENVLLALLAVIAIEELDE